MKKFAAYILPLILLITACGKDKSVFNETPDERINKTLSEYQAALVSSPTGWKATIIPGSGGIFHFYFRFNNENRVFMFSDFDTTTSKYQKESSYRLKALQQPTLIFDTYSYLHLLADPDASVNGGDYGAGLYSDFEFSLDTLYADSIILTGKVNKTRLKLERASQQDLDEWQNGAWADPVSFLNIITIQNYFKRLTLDGVDYEISVDPTSRTISLQWLSGATVRQFSSTFYFNAGGVVFETPLVNGAQTINGFTDVSWSEASQSVSVKSGNISGNIAGAVKPLKTDLNAPQRWWQESAIAGFWQSLRGFHVDGKDDAYGFLQMPGAPDMVFISQYGNSGGIVYDLLGFFGETVGFGAGYSPPTFTADGKVIFSILGVLGTVPAGANPAFSNTALTLADENGFYLIQKSEKIYDMVSAADSKIWITWGRP